MDYVPLCLLVVPHLRRAGVWTCQPISCTVWAMRQHVEMVISTDSPQSRKRNCSSMRWFSLSTHPSRVTWNRPQTPCDCVSDLRTQTAWCSWDEMGHDTSLTAHSYTNWVTSPPRGLNNLRKINDIAVVLYKLNFGLHNIKADTCTKHEHKFILSTWIEADEIMQLLVVEQSRHLSELLSSFLWKIHQ